ncbi:MAG: cyclic nucleotide-binding domain-containing protein [Gaiellaceae bacterium]
MAASGTARAVTRLVVANRALRRLIASYFVLIVVEYGSWITLLVIANARGGPTAAGLVAVAQLLPSIALGPPLTKALARFGLRRGLTLGYALQTVGLGAVAAAVAAGLPLVMIALPAIVYSVAVGATRPMHAAFLPSAVRLPQELAAANVASSWADGLGALAGPAFAGVLLASAGESAAMLAFAAVSVLAAPLVAGAGISSEPEDEPGEEEESVAGIIEALRVVAARPSTRTLVAFAGGAAAVEGAMDLLVVVLAVKILMLGPGAAGYFAAAFGAGGLAGGVVAAWVMGRRLAPVVIAAALGGSVALAALAGVTSASVAVALLVVVGMSRTVQAVSAQTLLQRSTPFDVLVHVFAVMESIRDFGLAIGVVVTPALIAVGGTHAAFLGFAAIAPLIVVLTVRRLRQIDSDATIPVVEMRLLRNLPVFAALPAAPLEALVHESEQVVVPAGEDVIREGDEGDRYYAIIDGTVAVVRGGVEIRQLTRGEGFGEIALLHNVPRTATVRAIHDTHLLAIGQEPFLTVLTEHSRVHQAAHRVASARLSA